MKRFVLAASAAAVMGLSALPSTAAACDPNFPTCGYGTPVENTIDWTERRTGVLVDLVEDRLDDVAVGCIQRICP